MRRSRRNPSADAEHLRDTALVVGGLVLVAGIGYWLYSRSQDSTSAASGTGGVSSGTSGASSEDTGTESTQGVFSNNSGGSLGPTYQGYGEFNPATSSLLRAPGPTAPPLAGVLTGGIVS